MQESEAVTAEQHSRESIRIARTTRGFGRTLGRAKVKKKNEEQAQKIHSAASWGKMSHFRGKTRNDKMQQKQ